jgi:hypothetical protein
MGRTRRQKRKGSRGTYIDRLPTELLLDIFIQFWALDYGTHDVFLQVCRGWRAVAQSTKIFLTKVMCGRVPDPDRMPSYIQCYTPKALSNHFARIDGMKFELLLYGYFADESEDWTSVLGLYLHNCYKISSNLGNFTEYVIQYDTGVRTNADILLDELLEGMIPHLEPSSIKEMSIHTLLYNNRFLTKLYMLTSMWNGLHVLSLQNTRLSWDQRTRDLFSSLQNLRELSLVKIGDGTWSWFRSLSAGPPGTSEPTMNIGSKFLIKLIMHEVSLDCFHDSNYHNLVEFSYSPTRQFTPYVGKVLTLPRLRRICVIHDWEIMAYIRAPNIEAVELTQGYFRRDSWDIQGFSIKDLPFQALRLHLSRDADQETFIHILSKLSIPTLIYLRLEQGRELSVSVMQKMFYYVKNGLDVWWNGAVVSGDLEQLATWVETGHLVVEN